MVKERNFAEIVRPDGFDVLPELTTDQ